MIQKLDHNSGLHAKNQREISSNSQWPFSGGKCGNGKWYKERGNGIRRGENGIRRGENGIRRGENGIRRGGNAL